MPKEIEKVIIRYMDSLFTKHNNKVMDFKFHIIEGNLFLYIQMDNGSIKEKHNLYLDASDLAELYMLLYQEFKENYINSQSKFIKIYEERDLSAPDRSYLKLLVRDVHKNIINLELKDHNDPLVVEILNEIKNDWISLAKEMKSSKNK
ncbi:MAG: hypothetical protein IJ501_00940 [Bacilli bacterium]|nr:hypothetical protein [Bacilli bacterium]